MKTSTQLNVRMTPEARELLKLLCYLCDTNESTVIQAALNGYAFNSLQQMIAVRLSEIEPEKFALLLRTLSASTGARYRYEPATGQVEVERAGTWDSVKFEDLLGPLSGFFRQPDQIA